MVTSTQSPAAAGPSEGGPSSRLAGLPASELVERVRESTAGSLIDVRSGLEFEGVHIPGSHLVPLHELPKRVDEILALPAPRLLLCRTGDRAARARDLLAERGVPGLAVVEGGLEAYQRAGGEIRAGEARMSLERQVRIAAGSLVLLGLGLGWLVHPGFLGLSVFVGAGLVFAGVSDWCGMGLLLARAPWNRRTSDHVLAGDGCASPSSHAGDPACATRASEAPATHH
jgi:rhodanese-related sulfurtransferase